jgi:hypothetical protein
MWVVETDNMKKNELLDACGKFACEDNHTVKSGDKMGSGVREESGRRE